MKFKLQAIGSIYLRKLDIDCKCYEMRKYTFGILTYLKEKLKNRKL